MSSDIIKQQKITARKNIARYNKLLSNLSAANRLEIIQKIASEKRFLTTNLNTLDFNQLLAFIHQARHTTRDNCQECLTIKAQIGIDMNRQIPTLGHLRELLEQNAINEWNAFSKNPSSNDLKRWALKSAVSDYYNSLNYDSTNPAVETLGSLRTINQLAPNKEWIYRSFMDKLNSLVQRKDIYRLDPKEYDESYDRGTPRGGAFEKQLDRYREEFMQQLNRI